MNKIVNMYNLEIYKPSWLEKLILYFCAMQTMDGDAGTIYFKYFSNRLYIYRVERKTMSKDTAIPWSDRNPYLN